MSRLINADALTEDCKRYLGTLNPDKDGKECTRIHWLIGVLENAPTIEPERKTGKWVDGKCDQCGCHAPYWSMSTTYYKSNYCPECGVKMEGPEDIPMEYFESGGR